MSALEGDMDARIAAGDAAPRGVTANLATAAALRAFGSAAAAALAPRVIAANGVGALSIALVTVLAAAVVVTLARHRNHWALSGTGAATNPG